MTTPFDPTNKPTPEHKPTTPPRQDDGSFLHDDGHDPSDDSSVDLGHHVGAIDPLNPAASGSQSGISVVDWASLVEDLPAPPPEAPVAFDAPSDAELLFSSAPSPVVMPPSVKSTVHTPAIEATIHAPAEAKQPAAAEPPPPPAEEDVAEAVLAHAEEEVVEASAVTEDDVSTFLAEAPEPPAAVEHEAVEVVEEIVEATAASEDDVAAFLAEAPEPPTTPEYEAVEEVVEATAATEDEVTAFLAEEPEPPAAVEHEAVEAVEEIVEATAASEDDVAAFLAEAPAPPAAHVEEPIEEIVEATAEDEVVTFLADEPEPPLAAHEEAVEVIEEATLLADEDVASFLAEAPVPPPAPAEPEEVQTAVAADMAALLAEEPETPMDAVPEPEAATAATVAEEEAAAFLAEEPEPPPAAIEAVEHETAMTDDEVAHLLAEAPEPPPAPETLVLAPPVPAAPPAEAPPPPASLETTAVAPEDYIASLLAQMHEPPPAEPASGPIVAEVAFETEEAETAIPEQPQLVVDQGETPAPISEMARAEAVAFAAPEEVIEDVAFTPEALFEESPSAAGPDLPPIPSMELDSGRHLDDVVELGADSVVTGQSAVEGSGIIPEVVEEPAMGGSAILAEAADVAEVEDVAQAAADEEDETFLAEAAEEPVAGGSAVLATVAAVEDVAEPAETVEEDEAILAEAAEEPLAGGSAVLAEVEEMVEIAEVEDVAETVAAAEEDILELGAESVLVSESSANLSEVVAEVGESDVAISPAAPESDVIVTQHESGLDLDVASDSNKPISSGDVVMEDAVEAGSSGRDLIAEAVESGVDGTLALPGMELDSEVTISPDSGKLPSPPPSRREHEATREIQIPPSEPEPDDFFEPVEAAVVEEDEVIVSAEVEEVTTAEESSSIDLGSMPEMPIVPSSKSGSEVADIDLAALEEAASGSQRRAGKAAAQGEIDLGPEMETGEEVYVEEATEALPQGALEEGEIDFSALEDAATGSAPKSGAETVAFDGEIEPAPTADLDAEVIEEAAVEEGLFDEEGAVAVEDEGELVGATVGVEEEEEEKPQKKGKKEEKPKGRGGAWFGGTLLGTLVGAGACVGALMYAPDKVRDVLQIKWKEKVIEKEKPAVRDLIAGGKYDDALKAVDAVIDNNEKEFLRGQISLRKHLQTVATNGGADKDPELNLEDPAAKDAITILGNAKTGEADFELGRIYELAGDFEKAKASYTSGLQRDDVKTSPELKKALEAALKRLDLPKLSALPRHAEPLDARLVLIALLVFAADEPAGVGQNEEAGWAFRRAIEALGKNDYKAALTELQQAERSHKKGRLLRYGKQQNPESDPSEEIFLRCARELTEYWKLRQYLAEKQMIVIAADVPKDQIAATLQKGIEDKLTLAKSEGAKAIGEKLVLAKVIDAPDKVDKGVDDLLALRKTLAEKVDPKVVDKPEEYEKANKAFLDPKGGYDQLVDERKLLGDALLAAAKKVGTEDDAATKVDVPKLTVRLTDLVETEKYAADAFGALLSAWEESTKLQANLTTKKEQLVEAQKFNQRVVNELAQALIDTGRWTEERKNELTPDIVLDTTIKIVRMKLPKAVEDLIKQLLELQTLVVRLESTVNLAVAWWDSEVKEIKQEHAQAVIAINDKHAKAVAALNAEITLLQEGVDLAIAWWNQDVTSLVQQHKDAIAALEAQHAAVMKLVRTPAQMLPHWLSLLDQRDNKGFVEATVKDAQADINLVLNDPKRKKEDEVKAKIVQALTLRNLGQYAEAEKILKEVEKDLPPDGAWAASAAEAFLESKDVVAYYGRKADELANHIYPDKAIVLLDRMLPSAPPAKKGDLLAQRGFLRLEMAMEAATVDRRSIRKFDPLVQEALKNLDDAGDVAAAHYVRGRIHEELSEMREALAEFRKAVAMHDANDEVGQRYKAAVARALSATRLGRLDRDDDADALALSPEQEAQLTLVLLTVMLQPPPPAPVCPFPLPFFTFLLPAAEENEAGLVPLTPEQIEANKLADQILADPLAPFDARAKAWMVKGDYTEALRVFARGLEVNRQMRAEHAATLNKIIREHPRLSRPRLPANPLEAEIHYGNGLRSYFAGQYAAAERHFQAAVDAVDGEFDDARYYYYLAMAQLGVGKRKEAAQNFADGVALERRNMPSRVAVNASLERVQGPLRRLVDDERNRVR